MYKRRIWAALLLFLFSVSWASSYRYSKPTVTPFGTFKPEHYVRSASIRYSENGCFSITYNRQPDGNNLVNVSVFKKGKKQIEMHEVPGSGAIITNAGYLIITGEGETFRQRLQHFSLKGELLSEVFFKDPDLFEISPDGTRYAIGSNKGITIVDVLSGKTSSFPKADQIVFSSDNTLIATADGESISLYAEKERLLQHHHNQLYIRSLAISPDKRKVAFISKKTLSVLDTKSGTVLLTDSLTDTRTFREIRISDDTVWAGIHNRDRKNRQSVGQLRSYSLSIRSQSTEDGAVFNYPQRRALNYDYGTTRKGRKELPWPFEPFDKPQKQWNGYLQLAASRDGTSGTYCHQGLDMDVPSYARCYSIDSGYVKCKLTIMNPGDLYWRVAVSEIQTPDTSDGWLYAHLEKSTIGVDVGDEVLPGDYIGEIIPWDGLSGGHIHFARIRDHGSSWKYSDDQWWNIYSPLEQLRPLNDNSAPTIMDCFPNSKFGIMTNDGDGWTEYIDPTDVSGQIDILVRVQEKAWQSPWLQPAYEIKYWLKNLDKDQIVLDTTLGIKRRNSIIAQYSGALYNNLSPVMYHITNQFKAKGWFSPNRDYVHIITNVTDTIIMSQSDIDAMESNALNSADFADGNYRLYVKVFDAAYNSTLDSMDMVFNNGVSVLSATSTREFAIQSTIKQNITLTISSPESEKGIVRLFTLSGRIVAQKEVELTSMKTKTLELNEKPSPGTYLICYNSQNRALQRKIVIR